MDMSNQKLFRNIDKQTLCDYLGVENNRKIKKEEYEKQVLEKIYNSDLAYKEFFNQFEIETSLIPIALEDVLSCSKTERLRWTKEGKLKVVGFDTFKYGKYPLFSWYQLEKQITPKMIGEWRTSHKAKSKQHSEESKKKAKETKNIRQSAKNEILENLKQEKAEWYAKDYILSATFELAYWTVWLSRLAKTYHEKYFSRRVKRNEEYSQKEDECYNLKNKAVFELAKSPYASLSYYRPNNPNKISFYLCEDHYENFREIYAYNNTIREYVEHHKKEIKKCPDCIYEEEKEYYSLYYLELKSKDFPEIKFSFHTPYDIGINNFGNPKALTKVHHKEQDGMFRFGRSLEDEEKYTFTFAFVKKQFDKAMETFVHVMKNKK